MFMSFVYLFNTKKENVKKNYLMFWIICNVSTSCHRVKNVWNETFLLLLTFNFQIISLNCQLEKGDVSMIFCCFRLLLLRYFSENVLRIFHFVWSRQYFLLWIQFRTTFEVPIYFVYLCNMEFFTMW